MLLSYNAFIHIKSQVNLYNETFYIKFLDIISAGKIYQTILFILLEIFVVFLKQTNSKSDSIFVNPVSEKSIKNITDYRISFYNNSISWFVSMSVHLWFKYIGTLISINFFIPLRWVLESICIIVLWLNKGLVKNIVLKLHNRWIKKK